MKARKIIVRIFVVSFILLSGVGCARTSTTDNSLVVPASSRVLVKEKNETKYPKEEIEIDIDYSVVNVQFTEDNRIYIIMGDYENEGDQYPITKALGYLDLESSKVTILKTYDYPTRVNDFYYINNILYTVEIGTGDGNIIKKYSNGSEQILWGIDGNVNATPPNLTYAGNSIYWNNMNTEDEKIHINLFKNDINSDDVISVYEDILIDNLDPMSVRITDVKVGDNDIYFFYQSATSASTLVKYSALERKYNTLGIPYPVLDGIVSKDYYLLKTSENIEVRNVLIDKVTMEEIILPEYIHDAIPNVDSKSIFFLTDSGVNELININTEYYFKEITSIDVRNKYGDFLITYDNEVLYIVKKINEPAKKILIEKITVNNPLDV